jgi:hypothetical protein
MQTTLTKSRFLQFLSCPHEFWLSHHFPELFKREPTLESDHFRDQGYKFQGAARELSIFSPDPEKFLVRFEQPFETGNLYAKADAVITDLANGELSIYEIKSSGSVKPEHLYDLAFQKAAAEGMGLTVVKSFVITADTSYVRNGDIDPEALCTVHDVTDKVLELADFTRQKIAEAFQRLDAPQPQPVITDYCDAKLDCSFIRHHFHDLPDYTVFDLAGIKRDRRDELLSAGVIDIRDIPAEFNLTDRQRKQVEVARSGEARIDVPKIKETIDALAYPVHFLDYETFGFAVPQYEGMLPFQPMVFQYSLHTIREPGAEPDHNYFLSKGDGIPPYEMALHLQQAMKDGIGSVIVWNEQFEKGCNGAIAARFPEFEEFMAEVNVKSFDLMTIFSKQYYLHPLAKGSSSIKNVLPALVPELQYDELTIGDGMTASIKWFHMATKRGTEEERQATFEALREYCHLDTVAMVEIFNVLKAL